MDPLDQIRSILEATATEGKAGEAKTKQASNISSVKSASKASTSGTPSKNAEEILTGPGVKENDAAQNANAAHKAKFPTAAQSGAGASPGKLSQRNEEEDTLENAEENTEELAEKKDVEADDSAEDEKKDSSEKDDSGDDDKKSKKKGDKSDFAARMMAARKGKGKNKNNTEESVHIDALFSGETLSEEFKAKALTIFEAALAERESQLCEAIAEEYEGVIAEGLDDVRAELAGQLDSYIDYIAEQWMQDNALQVENGLKSEITESFLNGLRGLFLEHDINVPDTKVDLLDELADKVGDLEEQLNSEMNTNVELMQKLEEYRKSEVVAELGEELASTQFEKFATLCEGVAFDNEEDFKKKATIVKDNYFKTEKSAGAKKVLTEAELVGDEVEEGTNTEEVVISENMNSYMGTLSRLAKSSGRNTINENSTANSVKS